MHVGIGILHTQRLALQEHKEPRDSAGGDHHQGGQGGREGGREGGKGREGGREGGRPGMCRSF